MGCAIVLQGRYIEHQALRCRGTTERITMVTSFRPRDPMLPDDTVLTTVRPISNLSELYFQFGEYRLEMLIERTHIQLSKMREAMQTGRKTDVKALKHFLREQEKFLAYMRREIIEEECVKNAEIDQSHLFMEEQSQPQENCSSKKRGHKRKRIC